MEVIIKGQIFGVIVAYFGAIEWQKRGLPHAHFLFTLAEEDVPRTPEDIEKIVSAEIPDPDSDDPVQQTLHELVKKYMVHGPCDLTSPCHQNDKKTCDKKYPKRICNETILSENGFIEHRRADKDHGGHEFEKKVKGHTKTLDNRWIVPYNPYLLLKFQAHINVEIVVSINGVKYVYKYTTKGPDRITVQVSNGIQENEQIDEVQQFIDCRYISCSEAIWRIQGFPLIHRWPPVKKLPIHLPGEQTVFYGEEANTKEIQEAMARSEKTMLTEFFTLCSNDEEAAHLTYLDVMRYYTWNNKDRKFVKRKQNQRHSNKGKEEEEEAEEEDLVGAMPTPMSNMVSRIPTIPLNAYTKEKFFLRMLLHIVKGPKSFDDLKTVNGFVCENYQRACILLGIFEDDSQIEATFEEAHSITTNGDRLRHIFVTLLVHAMPADPLALWEKFKDYLAEDYIHKLRLKYQEEEKELTEIPDNIYNTVLLKLKSLLEEHGKDLKDFGLPEAEGVLEDEREPLAIREEMDYAHDELAIEAADEEDELNEGQRKFYDEVITDVDNEAGGLFALDAPGGTGKTKLTQVILKKIRSQNKIAVATATSGIASTLLTGGRTVHTKVKLPIQLEMGVTKCSIQETSALAEMVRRMKFMVIDEVTMGDKAMFDTLDRSFREIRGINKPFGGVTMLFSGDWRQCLPVVQGGNRPMIVFRTFKRHEELWPLIKIRHLVENMRIKFAGDDDKSYAKFLLEVGEGKIGELIDERSSVYNVPIPEDMKSKQSNIYNFCDEIFENIKDNHKIYFPRIKCSSDWDDYLMERAIISAKNSDVEEINRIMIEKLDDQPWVYYSADKVLNEKDEVQFPKEFLNHCQASGMPPHVIVLKKGAPIMLIRNLDPKNGAVNGARYIVLALKNKVIHARLATGPHKGEKYIESNN